MLDKIFDAVTLDRILEIQEQLEFCSKFLDWVLHKYINLGVKCKTLDRGNPFM